MASQSDNNATAGSKNRGGEATSSTTAIPPPSQETLPPPAAASTSGAQTPTPGAPSTAKVSVDLLGQLLKALRPDLEVSQVLGLLAQPTQPSASAVPPETETTPPSAQPVPATADEPAEETRAISEIEAVPRKGGEKEKEKLEEEKMEATVVMVEEEKGTDPQAAENIVDMEMLTGPTEEPEKDELTQAVPEA